VNSLEAMLRWVDVSAEYVTPLLERHLDFIRRCSRFSMDVLSVCDESVGPRFGLAPGTARFSRSIAHRMANFMDDPGRPEAYAPVTAQWLRETRRGRIYVGCRTGLYNVNYDPKDGFTYVPGSLTESPQDCALRLEHAEYLAEQAKTRAERERLAREAGVGLYGVGAMSGLGPPSLWRRLP
jgi:hypothetical protein